MRYRNTKTGAIIEVPSKLGGNWELVGGKSVKTETAAAVPSVEEKAVMKSARKTRKTKK